MKELTFLVVLAIVLQIAQPAFGYPITVEVEGVVTWVETYDGLTLDDSVTVGSTIMTGSFTYDTEAPDHYGTYPLISISMSVGNYTALPRPGAPPGLEPQFSISVDSGTFLYMVGIPWPIFSGPCYLDGEPTNMEDLDLDPNGCGARPLLLYGDNDGTITDALPDENTFPDLSAATEWKSFDIGSGPDFLIAGEITSITVIPEPGTILLFGLGGLALLRRRRK